MIRKVFYSKFLFTIKSSLLIKQLNQKQLSLYQTPVYFHHTHRSYLLNFFTPFSQNSATSNSNAYSCQLNCQHSNLIMKIKYSIQSKKKIANSKQNKNNLPSKQVLLSSLPVNQQISHLKQSIQELLQKKQDNRKLMDLIEQYSQIFLQNSKLVQGLKQFDRLAGKIRSIQAFKNSPNYNLILEIYRMYLVRNGRIDESILITEQCYALLKKHSKQQNIFLANQLQFLGVCYFLKNNLVESRKYFDMQLKINLKVSDQTYKDTVQCTNHLAIIDFCQGKYEEAEKKFIKNLQMTKRIQKSSPKSIQISYLKHFSYLQAIYSLKLQKQKDQQLKQQYQMKIKHFQQQIQQILLSNANNDNDLSLYYETIADSLLKKSNNVLCLKFIQKALKINNKNLQKLDMINQKVKKHSVSADIARQLTIFSSANQQLKRFKIASQNFQKAMNIFKKIIKSSEAKQILSLTTIQNFIDCCRKMFYLQFIEENENKLSLQQSIELLETPLLMWQHMIGPIWNIPKRFIFIPYQINIQIGIKLLELHHFDAGIKYIGAIIKQIQQNEQFLCKKSRQNLKDLQQKLENMSNKMQNSSLKNLKTLKQIRKRFSSII